MNLEVIKRAPHSGSYDAPAPEPGSLHVDLKELVLSVGNFRYVVFAIDEYSRYVFVEFIKHKSEAAAAVKRLIAAFDASVGTPIDEHGRALPRLRVRHLHSDHAGDFAPLYIGGWMNGRYTPLYIYGPTGKEAHLGTKSFVENQIEAWAWDIEGRKGTFPDNGGKAEVQEFDYSKVQVIYEENGVTIKQFPAIHALDGSVSFRLDWGNRSFVFGGDSYPNKWFIENAKGADLVVHECFFTPETLGEILGTPYPQAVFITSYIHTPPQAFGKIMSAIEPRHAIGYHFWTWHDIYDDTLDAVRETYDGPLTLASDMTVWNVTDDQIVVREAIASEDVAPTGTTRAYHHT